METTTPTHPLVAKAAQQWLDIAARHNVPATLEPMPPTDSGFGAGGIYVHIDTGYHSDIASVAIYPPTKPGRRPAQSASRLTYHTIRGQLRWGRQPKITLRSMSFYIANFWNRPGVSA